MRKETSNNKHDGPCKISECFASQRTQKQLQHSFLNILQKYYQFPILGTLGISGHFHQKQKSQETLMLICKQKMNSILNF